MEAEKSLSCHYVAHLDMLGMSRLTIEAPKKAWDVLEKLDTARTEILSLKIAVEESPEIIADRVLSFTFSDTILLFSVADERKDAWAMLTLCSELFSRALSYSVPLRAAVTHGQFLFDRNRSLFAGPPLVRAHHLGEQAQWLGIRLDDRVAADARALPLIAPGDTSAIVEWDVPIRNHKTARGPVLDWVIPHRSNFSDKPPITAQRFYSIFESLFGPFSDLDRLDQLKYENTINFVNARLGASMSGEGELRLRKDWHTTMQLGIVTAVLICGPVEAQQPKMAAQEPKTQLEAFEKQIGTVIIKGFSTLGVVSGAGSVSVECMEFANVSTGKRQLGIVIEVTESGRLERSDRSFIDYDEIDPLLKGIDYVSKVTPESTKLQDFEAIYKTKGDVTVIAFSGSDGKIAAAVKSGYVGATTAYISTAKLAELRALILRAREKLDSIK